jgi:hypothetical protein
VSSFDNAAELWDLKAPVDVKFVRSFAYVGMNSVYGQCMLFIFLRVAN